MSELICKNVPPYSRHEYAQTAKVIRASLFYMGRVSCPLHNYISSVYTKQCGEFTKLQKESVDNRLWHTPYHFKCVSHSRVTHALYRFYRHFQNTRKRLVAYFHPTACTTTVSVSTVQNIHLHLINREHWVHLISIICNPDDPLDFLLIWLQCAFCILLARSLDLTVSYK